MKYDRAVMAVKVILDPVLPDPDRRGSMSDPIQKRPRRFARLPYSILNE